MMVLRGQRHTDQATGSDGRLPQPQPRPSARRERLQETLATHMILSRDSALGHGSYAEAVSVRETSWGSRYGGGGLASAPRRSLNRMGRLGTFILLLTVLALGAGSEAGAVDSERVGVAGVSIALPPGWHAMPRSTSWLTKQPGDTACRVLSSRFASAGVAVRLWTTSSHRLRLRLSSSNGSGQLPGLSRLARAGSQPQRCPCANRLPWTASAGRAEGFSSPSMAVGSPSSCCWAERHRHDWLHRHVRS